MLRYAWSFYTEWHYGWWNILLLPFLSMTTFCLSSSNVVHWADMCASSVRYSRRKVVDRWKSLIRYLDERQLLPILRCAMCLRWRRQSPQLVVQICSPQPPQLRLITILITVTSAFCFVLYNFRFLGGSKTHAGSKPEGLSRVHTFLTDLDLLSWPSKM